MSSSSSDAALLREIQRLSGAIDRHKYSDSKPPNAPGFPSRNSYVNPTLANRKYVNPAVAHKKYVNPAFANQSNTNDSSGSTPSQPPLPSATRELVINGVAFQTSSRKLTRKDLITNKPESSSSSRPDSSVPSGTNPRPSYVRKDGNLVASTRVHKPRFSKRKRLGGRNNMVLDNVKGTRTGHVSKRRKLDKQCRFFTMTGVCQRGLTCPYQHDPEKIAICPLFLTRSCPNSGGTCHLSHNPTPERVPPCHHFANHGRCTREGCPYPHIRIGPREGVCRDFAVVGYCDKGIECDKQHVRECPDFAEKGLCSKSGCKLPHVIRANRKRQLTASTPQVQVQRQASKNQHTIATEEEYISSSSSAPIIHSANTAALGTAEEYISLTFEESDDDDDDEEDEEKDSGEDEEDEDEGQREKMIESVIVD